MRESDSKRDEEVIMRNCCERESSSGGMFVLGAVAGALAGAGVALLMAPKSGAEVREDIGASFGALRDAAKRRYRDMADRAGVQLENLEEKADELADQLEASARQAIDAAASKAKDATTRLRDGVRLGQHP